MRLDRAMVDRGLARSRSQAQELIEQGRVGITERSDSGPRRAAKPAQRVTEASVIAIAANDGYVSRGGYKLVGALADFRLQLSGRALDAGASTGGFSQVLLQQGCARVYAVDVGHDQLADEGRHDPRVTVWERTNLRDLELSHVDHQPVDVVVADVSFISLTLLAKPLLAVLSSDGVAVFMVKPQFEVGRERLGKGGVVRSEVLHRTAIDQVARAASLQGWRMADQVRSRLPGPAGNVEYFILLRRRTEPTPML